MPSRTYQVNYELNGISTNAIKAFESLKAPMSEISSQMKSLTEGMQMLNKQLESFRALSESIVFKPKINTKSFADALATMESNVKMSSMRMRASLEAALSGSASDHARVNNLLGTGNWRKMESEQRAELKSMEENMKLLKNIRDKFSSGKSDSSIKAKKDADALLSAYKDKGIDPYERASRLLKKAGIGGILNKSSNGWGLAGGDSRSKLKDFISKLEAESAELNKSIEQAAKKNQQALGNVAKETSFNRRGSFVERMLGVSPEQLKEIQPTLNALNSLMGGVGQTQAKMREVVKKTPIPKPIAPKDLLADSDYDKLVQQQKELTERYNGISAQMQNPHTKRVETLKKQIKVLKQHNKTTASLEDELRRATGSEAAWNASSGSFKSKEYIKVGNELSNVGTKISNARKVWTEYNTKLNEWKKQPYTETIERIPEAVSKAKMASSPIAINIKGNFTSKVKDIAELSSALSSLPKSAIEIPINITMPNGIVASLSAVRKELQAIDATRGKLAKGSYKGLSKAANAVNKPNEKVVNVKAAFDGSIINTEFNAAIDSLRKLAQSNTLLVKAKVDTKGVLGDFKSFLSKIKGQAKKTALAIKVKLELSNIGKQFREKISALKKAARTANIAIKAKFDSTGINKKFREAISKLKTTASKSVITIKAKFDTGDITKNLKQSLSGLAKSTKAAMPSIKVKLDITEAKASLQKLIAEIKAASPQTIKVGTSQSRAAIAEIARQTTSSAKAEASKNNMASAVASGAVGGRIVSSRPGFVDRLRKHMYPLTGNVSLGASTPVALDMAKGMGMMYGIGGAMNLVTGGFNDAMEYQNTMETAEEILRKNYNGKNFEKDFKDMSTEVRRVAKQTKFTAPQAADATRFMAMAGLDIPMIKSSVSPIADVAVIGDNDFGEVADKMTNIQTAFGILPKDMRHVADAITNTFTHTNTDMMMLAESMQYAAPMAHLAGMNIEDTLAMIGIMGNSGIQASMAGTTLRMMMQNTLNPNKKQAALWKKLGVGTRDSSGNLRNMIDILADVKVAAKDKKLPMADVVSNLFRVTASAGAGALIQNIDQVKELAKQNQFVGNVSGEISARKQNTAKGMWAQMTSAFTEANLKVFEQFQGDIIEMIKAVRDYFSSSEAVENLRQAFDFIKDLMKAFGFIAKKWMWLYNKAGWLVKIVTISQLAIAQFGLVIKPIMSLVNVFGGLKNLAIDFVGALSSGMAIKKASATVSTITATNGAVANRVEEIFPGLKHQDPVRMSPLKPANTNVSAAGLYTPYPIYMAKMDELAKKKMFYEIKGNRLRNSVQKSGSLVREAINPFLFGTMSMFNPKNKNDIKYMSEFMKNRTAMANMYSQHPFQRDAMLRAYQMANNAGMEMRSPQQENVMRLTNLRQIRRPEQLNNLPLLLRYNKLYPGMNQQVSDRLKERAALLKMTSDARRKERLSNVAYMASLYWSGKYRPGVSKEVDDYFAMRKNNLIQASVVRRGVQEKDLGLMYRYGRRYGKIKTVWGSSFKLGKEKANPFSFKKNFFKDFLISIRSGFMSVIGALAKGIGMLMGPIGIFTAAIAAAGLAAWGIYKVWKKQQEDKAKYVANSNAIQKQAKELNKTYSSNIAAVENGISTIPVGVKNPLKKYVEYRKVLGKKRDKQYGELEKNFSAINAITGNMSDENKARTIYDAYVRPNLQFYDTEGGKYAGKIHNLSFNQWLTKQTQNEYVDRTTRAGGMTPAAKLPNDNYKIDLGYVKKNAAIAQIYRAGASSKAAMDARKKIYEIYRNAKSLKDAQSQSRRLINELFGAGSIQAIGERDANYDSYNDITKASNLSSYKQYRWGAQNSLLNWVNNSNGTKLGYFEGVMKLREKLTPYTSEWQDAMSKIMSTMQVTFMDAKGKLQNVSVMFDKHGVPQWNLLYDQLKKLHVDFGHSFNDHLSVLAEILKQMLNNPELQEYIKQIGGIREWLMKEAMKMRDIAGGQFKDSFKQTQDNSFFSKKGTPGSSLKNEYNQYIKDFQASHSFYEANKYLPFNEWKKRRDAENKDPLLIDNKRRKELSKAVDDKIDGDETLKAQKKLEDIQNGLNNLGNGSVGGGRYSSPIADAAKDTNKQLGHNNDKDTVTARPTQINIHVDKLANFDKIQFLKGEEKDLMDALQRSIAEAFANMVPMVDSLVSNDKVVTA